MLSRLRPGRAHARLGIAAIAVAGALVMQGCDGSENADVDRGRTLFIANCGSCHQLAQAGTAGLLGPDLDYSFKSARADGMDNDTIEGVVQAQIADPREVEEGVPNYDNIFMPAKLVEGQDAEDVATYVASVAGVPGAAPPQLPPDQLFTERCGSCHVFAAAGTAGTTGPNLDEVLVGPNASPDYIREGIVDPNAEIAEGYSEGIMPANFEQSLTPEELDKLVDYIAQNLGGGSGN